MAAASAVYFCFRTVRLFIASFASILAMTGVTLAQISVENSNNLLINIFGTDGVSASESGDIFDPTYHPSTAGSAAGDITRSINATTYVGTTLSTTGGNGGDGINETDFGGSAGGTGGKISLTVSDIPDLSGSNVILYHLTSQGGLGGGGSENAPSANGGSSDAVSLTLNSSISLQPGGVANTLAKLTSVGGASGAGAYSSGSARLDIPRSFGGAGGLVSVDIAKGTNLTHTNDDLSNAETLAIEARPYTIFAQSIGGAGGEGGSVGGGLFNDYPGFGNNGGDAALATLTLDGTIATTGEGTTAVYLVSRGGDGGDGGTDGGDFDQDPGDAGYGGNAWQTNLSIDNDGGVTTHNQHQPAIVLSSLGGNGGSSGNPFESTDIGAFGGNGGNGNGFTGGTDGSGSTPVTGVAFANAGSVMTNNDFSPAVTLQSVGGNGGNGTGPGLDGMGGTGGSGGKVSGSNSGTISTQGSFGFGVFAQSVGGTGGNGGTGEFVGGDGGDAGNGGDISLMNSGQVITQGKGAIGIAAQSVGGGAASKALVASQLSLVVSEPSDSGGAGGSANSWFTFADQGGAGGTGGAAGEVSITNDGKVSTAGHQAAGIYAQSVGGGGATGGGASESGFIIGISRGGNGGSGGNGDSVVVTSGPASTVSTEGVSSPAIVAASIGGGGGNGGGANASTYSIGGGLSVAIGGDGGSGAIGGAVTVGNSGTIATQLVDSHGISAMSIGGGGGIGGQATGDTTTVGTPDIPGASFTSSIGGTGGQGADGGDITISNNGAITTNDHHSHGAVVHSIGGGGGNGANASSLASSILFGKDVDAEVSLGGNGGAGGEGGQISYSSNQETITTSGSGSNAIHLSSIGGGGGIGGGGTGTSSSATLAKQAIKIGVNLGGNGGATGSGGTVTLDSKSANITTNGGDATAIFIQSIGGGGGSVFGASASATGLGDTSDSGTGDGGNAGSEGSNQGTTIGVSIGGKGANSGNGGAISSTTGGTIETAGVHSHGVHAQSVGGSGGNGGSASAGTEKKGFLEKLYDDSKGAIKGFQKVFTLYNKIVNKEVKTGGDKEKSPLSWTGNLALGGNAGNGGTGGHTTIDNSATVSTEGHISHGLYAQSIGGGGGHGAAGSSSGAATLNLASVIGGTGGNGGDGGTIDLTNSGSITTNGNVAHGIFAQSIGAGGGSGGSASEKAGLSASIAGKFGGSGGVSGTGGTIHVTNTGSITTHGHESHGIVAQSIGGGGGALLYSFPTDIISSTNSGGSANSPEQTSGSVNLNFGGNGVSGSKGGTVSISHGNLVTTHGKHAHGIFAQSIGGGGGMSGGGAGGGNLTITGGFSGFGGSGNDGGSVSVFFNDKAGITTSGVGSVGLFVQSIGGGGGYAGGFSAGAKYSVNGFQVSDQGAGGDGGDINIGMEGVSASVVITTAGVGAHGIYAQSLGGGGGAAGSSNGFWNTLNQGITRTDSSGRGGTIDINLSGTLLASGDGSYGIFAQSGIQDTMGGIENATQDSKPVLITVSGDVTGSGNGGAAIRIDGGYDNSIDIQSGTISSGLANAIANDAIVLKSNLNGQVNNSGTVIGNIVFENSADFSNFANGKHYSGTNIDLAGGSLSNGGVLEVAGPNTIGVSNILGTFSNNGGNWNVDVEIGSSNNGMSTDELVVSGSAQLGGTINPRIIKLAANFNPQALSSTILTADEVFGYPLGVTDTRFIDYSLNLETPGQAKLAIEQVNFTSPAALRGANLSSNDLAAAQHLQTLWNTGALGALSSHVLGILQETSGTTYERSLQDLVPEIGSVTGATAPSAANQFHNNLHSFPVFVGETAQLSEQSGVFTRGTYSYLEHDNSSQTSSYDQDSRSFQLGGQQAFATNWFAGGSFAYTRNSINANDINASGDGDSYAFGVVLKKLVAEDWLLSGSLGYSFGSFDYTRGVFVAGNPLTAESNQDVHTFSGRIRGAYNIDLGHWYLRPAFGLDLVHVYIPGYSETGAGVLSMNFEGQSDTQVGLLPELEIGGRLDLDVGILRPYGKIGAVWWSDSGWSQTSRLAGAGAGAPGVVTAFESSDLIGRGQIGGDMVFSDGFDMKAQYEYDFADDFNAHTVSLRLAYRF
ncbi:MAG: hypothetical protein AAFX93_18410 [Verrucomicrobiota bacterium]